MYTIKQEQALTKLGENGDIQVSYLMHLTVDKISEIPAAKANWLAGSRCDVLEDNGHVYELSNSREWVEVNFFKRVSESGTADLSSYYTKPQTDSLLGTKVDKVSGMGLSQNSFTDAEKTKLAGLSNYDDTSLQSEISVLANAGAKNYLKLDAGLPSSVNGVSITYQEDGGICFQGTTTAPVTVTIFNGSNNPDWTGKHFNQKLILSGCPAGGGAAYSIQFWKYDRTKPSAYDNGDGVEFLFTNDGTVTGNNQMWRVVILISENCICDNLTFYPMLRDASVTDSTYQPYAMTNAELTDAVLTLLQNTGLYSNLNTTAQQNMEITKTEERE